MNDELNENVDPSLVAGDPTPNGPPADPPLEIAADTTSDSLVDRIRARHRELKGEHHLDLDVPGLQLVVRYKPISGKVIEAIAKKAVKAGKDEQTLTISQHTLIAACDQVLVRVDDESLEPLGKVFGLGDEPVKFDLQLAQALEFPAKNARDVVSGVFPTDSSIIDAYQRVDAWMSDVTRDVGEALLGE